MMKDDYCTMVFKFDDTIKGKDDLDENAYTSGSISLY
jgi:hypothetical protein